MLNAKMPGNKACPLTVTVAQPAKNVFDASSWVETLMKNHLYHDRDLVCSDCAERGYEPGKHTEYQCQECLGKFGSSMFDKTLLFNKKRGEKYREKERLACHPCRTHLRCSKCKTAYELSYWSRNERRNHSNPTIQVKLVCKECRARGINPHDLKTYKCQTCNEKFGALKFDKVQIHNYNANIIWKLNCLQCVARIDERLHRLRTIMKGRRRI